MDRHLDRGDAALSDRHPNRLPAWLLVALVGPPMAFAVVFYAWPLATLLAKGLGPGAIADVLGRSQTWDVVWFTSWQAVVSTALTIVLGIVPAYVCARFQFRGRRAVLGLLTAVFVLPTVVVGAAILAVLPDSLDRSIWAVLGAHVVFNLAVVVRTVGAVWEHLPPDLEAAAATLGASPLQVARHVTLPLLRPAITAAAAIVFLFTFTSFGVIRILGGGARATIEVEVWRRATQLGEIDAAAVLSVLQLIIVGGAVGWSVWSQRRHGHAIALRPRAVRRKARTLGERRLVVATAAGVSGLLVVPLLALGERSVRTPDGYSWTGWTTMGRAEVRRGVRLGTNPLAALVNSLEAMAVATTLSVAIGGLATLAVAAARRGRWLDTGLMLPLGTSAVTIGFGMLITFDTAPVDWRASSWLLPVGHALIAVPFVVRSAIGVLRAVDPRLVEAAATLGATPARAWASVTLPHLWRPLATGAGLAAAISLGEFGATSFLSRRTTETLPIAIERLLGRTGSILQAQGYALAVILAAVTIALVMLSELVRDRARRS
ncbi:MAG: iron ABC transporter permease [Ilumatobacteraceae bacterium]